MNGAALNTYAVDRMYEQTLKHDALTSDMKTGMHSSMEEP